MRKVAVPLGETVEQRREREALNTATRLAGVTLATMPPSQTPNIKAHDDDPHCRHFHPNGGDIGWREPRKAEPYSYPYRTCTYCGSIHPEDLLTHLKTDGASGHWADFKYGWPHKLYVDGIANPNAGLEVHCGSARGGSESPVELLDQAPNTVTAKFYSVHLKDMPDALRDELVTLLGERTRVWFLVSTAGDLHYCCSTERPQEAA